MYIGRFAFSFLTQINGQSQIGSFKIDQKCCASIELSPQNFSRVKDQPQVTYWNWRWVCKGSVSGSSIKPTQTKTQLAIWKPSSWDKYSCCSFQSISPQTLFQFDVYFSLLLPACPINGAARSFSASYWWGWLVALFSVECRFPFAIFIPSYAQWPAL